MKQFIGIVLALSSFLFAFDLPAIEQEADPAVQGVGIVKSRNVARARSQAIESALLKSVMLKTKDLLGEEAFAKNEAFLNYLFRSESKKLVKDFRIQKERRLGNSVVVDLIARAEEERIRDQLEVWGVLYERGRRPHFGMVNFETDESSQALALSSLFLQRLIGLGYAVGKIDDLKSEAVEGFDLVFSGSLRLDGRKNLILESQVHLSDNRGKNRIIREKTERPRSVPRDGDPIRLQVGMSVVQFLEKALPLWLDKVGRGNLYRVDFLDLPSFRTYSELLKFFRSKGEGFSGAKERRFSRGKVMFEVFFDGDTSALVSKIKGHEFKGVRFGLKDRTGRDLVFQTQ